MDSSNPPITYLQFPVEGDAALSEAKRRLGMNWGAGDSAVFFIAAASDQDNLEVNRELDQLVMMPEWGKFPETRRNFLNGTHVNFRLLQSLVAAEKALKPSTSMEVVRASTSEGLTIKVEHKKKLSRKYLDHMSNQIKFLSSVEPQRDEELETFHNMLILWAICEMMFITGNPSDAVIEDFLEWVNLTDPEVIPAEGIRKLLQADLRTQNEGSKSFWDHLIRLLLRGKTDGVRDLLTHYPASIPTIKQIDLLLRTMPRYTNFSSDHDFTMTWTQWHQTCINALNSLAPLDPARASFEEIQFQSILRILSGDLEPLQSIGGKWYEKVAGDLLFLDPSMKAFDLIDHVGNEVLDRNAKLIDKAVIAALEHNVSQVLVFASQIDPWLSCHLSDFFYYCGQLELPTENLACDVREFFTLEYASSLMNEQSMWRIAVDYFSTCPVFGRAYIEQHLGSVTIDSEKKAQKILSYCQENKFENLYESISETLGEKKEKQGMLGQAIEYYLQANQVTKVERIVDRLMEDYWKTGSLSNTEVVQNISKYVHLTDRLDFLKRYVEFHELYRAGKFKEASETLIQILTINPAPKQFWPTVLVDAIPLLETQEVFFNTPATYEMMRCLEEVLISHRRSDFMRGAKEQQLEVVRLALVRNLARSMMQPGAF